MEAGKLILDYVYAHELAWGSKVFLTQPVGGGKVKDYSWAQTMDQARRMATHIKSLGLEPGSPRRYVFLPLDQAAEAVYPSSGLDADEVRGMLVAVATAFAVLGDWEALDELASAAVQTFRSPPG